MTSSMSSAETSGQQLVGAPFWQTFSPMEGGLQEARAKLAQAAQPQSNVLMRVRHRGRGTPLLLRMTCAPRSVLRSLRVGGGNGCAGTLGSCMRP